MYNKFEDEKIDLEKSLKQLQEEYNETEVQEKRMEENYLRKQEDRLLEEMVKIQKAHAYDILADQVNELKAENEKLRKEILTLKEDFQIRMKIALGYREIVTEHEKNIQSLIKIII